MKGIESLSFFNLDMFQGIATLVASDPKIAAMRIFLIFFGFLLIYLGRKGVLEGLLMIPMGLGMSTVNAAVLFWDKELGIQGTLFLNPLVESPEEVVNWLQIDWLQPLYSLAFSNARHNARVP